MGSAPLAPGTTEPHDCCPCVVLWWFMLQGHPDLSHHARLWLDNVELVRANRRLSKRVRQLEVVLAARGERAAQEMRS